MQDITELFQAYRECIRHTWNTYIRCLEDGERNFADVEDALFYAMITWQVGYGADQTCFHDKPKAHLRVVPVIGPQGTPVLWAHGTEGGRRWEWQQAQLQTAGIEAHFIDYFDWRNAEETTYRDWQYYRAKIKRYAAQPEMEGAEMLIEVRDAQIFFRSIDSPSV